MTAKGRVVTEPRGTASGAVIGSGEGVSSGVAVGSGVAVAAGVAVGGSVGTAVGCGVSVGNRVSIAMRVGSGVAVGVFATADPHAPMSTILSNRASEENLLIMFLFPCAPQIMADSTGGLLYHGSAIRQAAILLGCMGLSGEAAAILR